MNTRIGQGSDSIFSYLYGNVKFRITSHHPETVINRLRYDIPVRKILKTDKSTITFVTDCRCIDKVLSVSESERANVEIIYKHGLPVIVNALKKRAGLYIGAVAAVILVMYSSMFIWEVRVEGNTYVSDADIVKTLKTLGVCEGVKKNRDILEKVYNSFLMAESRISWISVNFDGTVAHVEVKETKQIPAKLDRTRNINVVAKSDGVIKRIDVLDGSREVEAGETVSKGQLLISSFIETKKTGTIMKAARGNVWATTLHNYDIYVPKEVQIPSQITSSELKSITILGKEIPLDLKILKNKNTFFMETEVKRINVFGFINLPLILKTESKYYYDADISKIDKSKAAIIAENELKLRVMDDLAGAEIIQKNYKVNDDETHYVFKYELMCIENIAKETEFEFN